MAEVLFHFTIGCLEIGYYKQFSKLCFEKHIDHSFLMLGKLYFIKWNMEVVNRLNKELVV